MAVALRFRRPDDVPGPGPERPELAVPSTAEAEARPDRALERDLIRRCLAGQREAFETFYRAHKRQVAATLYRVTGDRGELDDLVQEVFVIAFRGLARFRQTAKLSTWLYRICVNVALGRIRSRARKPLPVPSSQSMEETGPSPESPERLLERRDDVARVYRALDQLSEKKRTVLVLHEIEGLDLTEIAEILRVPQVTVRTRLHYARKEFHKLLLEDGNG